jgi:hypothetical protein
LGFALRFDFKEGDSHFDTQRFGLIGAGNYTPTLLDSTIREMVIKSGRKSLSQLA